jgi:multidrug efflux pump subunit AcrA (membrane-fusion protein)
MTVIYLNSTKQFLRLAFTSLLAVILHSTLNPANAENGHQGAVSALGRLQPQGGIIRVGAPSTAEAISGSMLTALLVKEGDIVEAGMLLAVTDSAAALTARKSQSQAEHQTAIREADALQSQADAACVLADVARRESERRVRLLEQKLASEEETEMALGHSCRPGFAFFSKIPRSRTGNNNT